MATAPSAESAVADLLDVLSGMGLSVGKVLAPDGKYDLVIDLTGEELRVNVEVSSVEPVAGSPGRAKIVRRDRPLS
jgi:hypothetical protein